MIKVISILIKQYWRLILACALLVWLVIAPTFQISYSNAANRDNVGYGVIYALMPWVHAPFYYFVAGLLVFPFLINISNVLLWKRILSFCILGFTIWWICSSCWAMIATTGTSFRHFDSIEFHSDSYRVAGVGWGGDGGDVYGAYFVVFKCEQNSIYCTSIQHIYDQNYFLGGKVLAEFSVSPSENALYVKIFSLPSTNDTSANSVANASTLVKVNDN